MVTFHVIGCHASFISAPFHLWFNFKLSCLQLPSARLSFVLVVPRCAFMSLSKRYESRAVQTTFSPPCSPCSVVSPQSSPVDGGPQSEISTSTVESSLQTRDNPSQNSDGSLVSYLSTPDRSMTTSRRVLKPRLTPSFPSRVTQIINSRIISEPATVPSFSVKSQIASQQRVVTMPEDIRSQRLEKEFILYPPEYEESPIETTNSFSISERSSSFAPPDVITTDISHSSSSPSSPDSVVIIHNKYHVSQAFLHQTSVQTKGKTVEGMTDEFNMGAADLSILQIGRLGQVLPHAQSPHFMDLPLFPMPVVHRKPSLWLALECLMYYFQWRGGDDHRRTR